VMFLLEVVAPWLLLLPVRPARQVGVLVQLPLQIAIMLTGNYNWFNFHTMTLLLPAWDSDFDLAAEPLPLCSWLLAPLRLWERLWKSRPGRWLGYLGALVFLGYSAQVLFPIRYDATKANLTNALFHPDALTIENRITQDFIARMLDVVLQRNTYLLLYAMLGISAVAHALTPPKGGRLARLGHLGWSCILGSLAVVYLGVTLLPMSAIHKAPVIPFRAEATFLKDALEPFHVTSSYGLFRRMTGVGQVPRSHFGKVHQWGGLPPSVVEVPAVIIEGSYDNKQWHEIPLRYAPSVPERAPRRTAPHQPRLDWQMWFAALGSYQHNAWFVHLIWKLLIGSPDVIDLLDHEAYPFKHKPPQLLRAWHYHYDFTRIASPWADRNPGAKIINATVGSPEHTLWWHRTRQGEYIPTVNLKALEHIAKGNDWLMMPAKKTRPAQLCSKTYYRVQQAREWGDLAVALPVHAACRAVASTRVHGVPLRKFTGFQIELPYWQYLWKGAGAACFFDGPMLVTGAVIGVALILQALLWALGCAFGCGRGRTPAMDTDKVKTE